MPTRGHRNAPAQFTRPPSGEIRVVLVRHAEAGDVEMIGCVGAPLTDRGEKQLPYIAERLAGETFEHIYASDMTRAHETAKAILKHHRGTPFTLTKEPREVGGEHLRRGRTSRRAGIPEKVAAERAAAGRFARRLLRHKGERVLVVCHGNFIRLLIALLSGVSAKTLPYISIGNTSVTVLTVRTGGQLWTSSPVRVDLANCMRHLPAGVVG